MNTKIIFSCQSDFQGPALQEILSVPAAKFIKWLGGGAGLIEYGGGFTQFSALLGGKPGGLPGGKPPGLPPMFIRHIFPAEYTVPYSDLVGQDTAAPAFMRDFLPRMDRDKSFSVQLRAADEDNVYDTAQARQKLSDFLKAGGLAENKRYPEQVISALIAGDTAYVGLSRAEENLSVWAGGMRHYAARGDMISRAGFKLTEALENYPIAFEKGSAALDLGAAPGGWTKVLVDMGFSVVSVDPVRLSDELQANKNVEYHSIRAHEYIRKSNKLFDLIVNDMSMNIMTSINFMISLKRRLKNNGYMIMTFKLTKNYRLEKIKEGITLLSKHLDVVYAKQLFHNRSEITLILRKR